MRPARVRTCRGSGLAPPPRGSARLSRAGRKRRGGRPQHRSRGGRGAAARGSAFSPRREASAARPRQRRALLRRDPAGGASAGESPGLVPACCRPPAECRMLRGARRPLCCVRAWGRLPSRSLMDLGELVTALNDFASLSLAESWDNVGLLVEPSPPHAVSTLFLTNDLTEAVMEEAVQKKADLVLSYHPPIFTPLKRVTWKTWKERLVVRALEHRIGIYSPHTAYDAVPHGVNNWLTKGLGEILLNKQKRLKLFLSMCYFPSFPFLPAFTLNDFRAFSLPPSVLLSTPQTRL